MGTETPDWTDKDVHRLFSAIADGVREENEMKPFYHAVKLVHWQNVAFPPHSAEECERKWSNVTHKMRKFRNLKDLLEEAEEELVKRNVTKTQYVEKHKLLLAEYQRKVENLRDGFQQATTPTTLPEQTAGRHLRGNTSDSEDVDMDSSSSINDESEMENEEEEAEEAEEEEEEEESGDIGFDLL